jgi:hypothetical protein
MKRSLVYTSAALAGLMLLVGGVYAQKGNGGGHGGGGHSSGGNHAGGHSNGSRSNAGHSGAHHGNHQGGSGAARSHHPTDSKPGAPGQKLGGSKNPSKPKNFGNGPKPTNPKKPIANRDKKQSPSSPKQSGPKSNPMANGKNPNSPNGSKQGGPKGGQKGQIDPAIAAGIKDLLGKIGDAAVLGALNGLLNGQALTNAQFLAIGEFCGNEGCGLTIRERRFLRTAIVSCCEDAGDEVVIIEDEDSSDGNE